MRITIFLLLSIMILSKSVAQEYGHELYSRMNKKLLPDKIYSFGDKYIIPTIFPGDTSLLITLDEEGNECLDYPFLDFKFSENSFIPIGTKMFFYGKNRTLENDLRVMSLESDFSVNWVDSFQVSENFSFPAGMVSTSNYLYTIAVNERSVPYHRNINVKKIDTTGVEVWSKNYNTNYYLSYPWQTIITNDENILISVGLKHTTPVGTPRHSQLIKLDSDGEILWDVEGVEGFENGATFARVLELNDSTIVQIYEIDRDQDTDFLLAGWYPYPMQLDFYNPSGQLIRDKLIKYDSDFRLISTAVEAGKGDYFFVAGILRRLPTSDNYASLIKFDSNGDTIWAKNYQHPDYTEPNNQSYFTDIIELENGDLVILGSVKTSTEFRKIWLMRINEYGCFGESECDDLITDTEEVGNENSKRIDVFPNPFKNNLYIDSEDGVKQYELYDMNGKLIKEKQLNGTDQNIVIPMDDIIIGQYVLLVYLENGEVLTELIVK